MKGKWTRWVPSEVDDWVVDSMKRDDEVRKDKFLDVINKEVEELVDKRNLARNDDQRRRIADDIVKLKAMATRHAQAPLNTQRSTKKCTRCQRFHEPLSVKDHA